MEHFENRNGQSVVEAMIAAIQANKDYLGEIDGLIGDGDHGMNMNKGFTLCQKKLEGQSAGFSEALACLGETLFNEIGGSMGPIYGTIFMGMADAGADRIDAEALDAMLRQAITDLQDIIQAQVGDKTLMDTLLPAYDAFHQARLSGQTFDAALTAMADAAEAGKNSTKNLVAKFGRSSRLGERSRGVLDAGAVSCCILLQAMARGIQQLLN